MTKDLITLADLDTHDLTALFEKAGELKTQQKARLPHPLLAGKSLAMIFEKPSLRTRVTFEVGMTQLGGHAIYLAPADIQLGQRETVMDAARNLERWVDGIVARTFSHPMVERLAQYAAVPVINGLTDSHHPCQILADLFTLREKKGEVRGLTVAFVGDGNNVCHSWIQGAAKVGVHLRIACPKGYEPDARILEEAQVEASHTGASIHLLHDPAEAVAEADVIYTDVWTSMGQEEERARRLRDFKGFQVNPALVRRAARGVLVMHCLPAHRGEEITSEVLDGPHSIVGDQAENRLHAEKAILVTLLSRGVAR